MTLRLSELAARLGVRVENAADDVLLESMALAEMAGAQELSFIPAARVQAAPLAGAVLVSVAGDLRNALVVDDVLLACARSSAWLPVRRTGAARRLRPRTLANSARIAASAHVGSGVVVGDSADGVALLGQALEQCGAQHIVGGQGGSGVGQGVHAHKISGFSALAPLKARRPFL